MVENFTERERKKTDEKRERERESFEHEIVKGIKRVRKKDSLVNS